MAATDDDAAALAAARTELGAHLKAFVDFPKPGVTFKDVSPIVHSPTHYKLLMDTLAARYSKPPFDGLTHVVAVESRGFMIGAPLALQLGLPFVAVRASRKMPGRVVAITVKAGPFSAHRMEIQAGVLDAASRVLIVDDIVATGGTTLGAADLVEACGARVVECAVVAELEELNGRARVTERGIPLFTLLTGAPGVVVDDDDEY